ncbi:MAG: xylan 1,4-beta-xylosidase [Ruminococcus sp.]|nr:xylan 1,4-beta-xylosidase [Ruminococcus sp.]
MAEKKNKRFVVTYSQDLGTVQIIQDILTGVNYLRTSDSGLTVLVDENGKPIITVPESKEKES